MANITAAGGRVRETNLSVQIRPVEINLTAVLMDDIARLLNTILKYAKGGRVCNLGSIK